MARNKIRLREELRALPDLCGSGGGDPLVSEDNVTPVAPMFPRELKGKL